MRRSTRLKSYIRNSWKKMSFKLKTNRKATGFRVRWVFTNLGPHFDSFFGKTKPTNYKQYHLETRVNLRPSPSRRSAKRRFLKFEKHTSASLTMESALPGGKHWTKWCGLLSLQKCGAPLNETEIPFFIKHSNRKFLSFSIDYVKNLVSF